MKKLSVFLCILLVSVFVLSGCGSSPATTAPVTTQPSVTTPKPVATTQPASTTTAPTQTQPAATTTTPTQAPASTVSKYGGTLKLVPYNAPATPLGYPAESDPNSLELAEPVLESLLCVKDSIQGVLATSWTIADDFTSITMNLRKGVKFHDGSDFNAQVAKWNLDLLTAAKKTPQFKSVDIIDDYTIRINLVAWDNSVLTNMERNTKMISKASFDKNGIEYTRNHPVGTGPFKFSDYQRDVRIYYVKNENYWVPGKPYLDAIEYKVIADDTVRKISFLNGELHVLRAAGTIAQELKSKGGPFVTIPGGTFVLIPDSKNATSPLANKTVRQAISYAIDREAIGNALGFGFASPAYQLYPGFPQAVIPGLQKETYNLDKAKQLLADAGYSKGFPVSIYTFVMTPKDYTNAIANMLGKIGITAKVEVPEAARYADLRFNGWNNGFMAHGLASGQNLNEWLNLYLNGVQFPSLKKSDGFGDALKASMSAKTLDATKLQAVLKVIADDEMVIPYAEEVAITFMQKGVNDTGMLKYSLDTWTPEDAWLTPTPR
jgi:peptide/nickel transport system substrate-binding protein